MEVILKTDIAGLGYKNDIVTIKAGYGRNYLIPKGYAIIANTSNKKELEENLKQAAHKAEKIKSDAEALAKQLDGIQLEIFTKAGDSGKIFGSVTTNQISEALKNKGLEIDKKKIILKTNIKMLGEYNVTIDLHKEVKVELPFKVSEE